jgi:tRNA uridine 5-carboxymethylaminomethyl modification enzyme
MRYPDKERHQIFLEKDGPELVYPSGLPTGLAPHVQAAAINSVKGLERTVIGRPGYAIEYDFSDPRDLNPTLESRKVKGLFFAGKINGTSGYEEAASLGIWAGVGAALRAGGEEPIVLRRDEALMGVMFDDLTVLGVTEPYRMFSSRAEYRLSLREDNADLRLSPLAEKLGLLDQKRKELLSAKISSMERGERLLRERKISPEEAQNLSQKVNIPLKDAHLHESVSAINFLKRPKVTLAALSLLIPELNEIAPDALISLETEIKFAGYLSRQKDEIEKLRRQESVVIPKTLDFKSVPGLTREAIESLSEGAPATLGQAGRMRGVTPASVSALAVYIKKLKVIAAGNKLGG